MKTFLKGLALLAAVTSVIWIAVMWRWQATQRDVDAMDLLAYLVALPLVVFGLLLALRWAVKGALAKEAALSAALATTGVAGESTGGGAPAPDGPEPEHRTLAWPVIDAWVSSAAGNNAADILDAAKAGKPRPVPDKTLRNRQGMPVTCARVDGLDTGHVRRAWERWARQGAMSPADGGVGNAGTSGGSGHDGDDNGEMARHTSPEHVWRALAALDDLLPRAVIKAEEWASGLPKDVRQAVQVRVLPSWPTGWSGAEVAGANHWLQRQLRSLVPAQHMDTALGGIASQHWTIQAIPLQSGPQAWQFADHLLMSLEQQRCDDLVLLLACHSDLSDASVRAFEDRDRLYDTDTQPRGCMPGEGAAALLLGRAGHDPAQAPGDVTGKPIDAARNEVVAWLHRPRSVRRDVSIEAAAKVSSEVTLRLARQAIDAARIAAADVGGLCCDSDQHSPRSTELLGTTIELLPDLDVGEDVRLLGVTVGYAAQTGALWAVAGAIEQAKVTRRPALALSMADEHWRMAAVVRPSVPGDLGVSP